MSLTHFIDTPDMKALFSDCVEKVKLPEDVKEAPILVQSQLTQGYASGLGTAYDYMMRFKLARYVNAKGQDVSDDGWIAGLVVDRILPNKYPDVAKTWKKILDRAWSLYIDYAEGKNDANTNDEKVAICVQYLAALDNLYRIDSFRPDFRFNNKVTKELLALSNATDLSQFDEPGTFHLNPHFQSRIVGPSDADIVAGRTLIELKNISKIQSPTAIIRQLMGYSALQAIDGLRSADGSTFRERFTHIGIFYSRFNRLVKWDINEIMTPENFERYLKGFQEHAKNFA